MKRGLGRGIDALIPQTEAKEGEEVVEIDTASIAANPFQPRREFDEAKIEELAQSLKEHGVLQPLIVRRTLDGYQLVAGERRLRAAVKAGMRKVPAVVRELTDRQAMEISLVENLQREDLGPLEEAAAYERLINEFGLTQDDVARRVGKSRSEVANTLRLLRLEPEVQELLRRGSLSGGHGKILVTLSRDEQIKVAREAASKGLSVRALEERLSKGAKGKRRVRDLGRGALEKEAEDILEKYLGSPVKVRLSGERGSITITVFGEEDLGRVVERIAGGDGEK